MLNGKTSFFECPSRQSDAKKPTTFDSPCFEENRAMLSCFALTDS
jgi:hypothetical protein